MEHCSIYDDRGKKILHLDKKSRSCIRSCLVTPDVFVVTDTFRMVSDDSSGIRFIVPHHYETNVKAAGDISNASRARRLAQEAVTLSTSLPLSASSSVFVRCDEERLDVMKVSISSLVTPSST